MRMDTLNWLILVYQKLVRSFYNKFIGVRRRMKSRTFTFKQDEELEFKK